MGGEPAVVHSVITQGGRRTAPPGPRDLAMNTISALVTYLTSVTRDEEGASMVEYGLLIAFIALIALVGVTLLGETLSDFFTGIAGDL